MLRFKDFLQIFEDDSDGFGKTDKELINDFNYINDLLFDGDVKPVPIKYFKSKSKAGIMQIKKGEIDHIGISSFYHLTRKQHLSVLAHEMIHVLMTQKDIPDNNDHGRVFMRMVDSCNKKQDEFVISQKENLSDVVVAADVKKDIVVGAILFKVNNKNGGAVFVNDKIINDKKELNDFCDSMKKYVTHPMSVFNKDNSVELEFYKCQEPTLTKYKIKRILNLRYLELYDITDDDLELIESGQKVLSCKVK